MGLNRHQRRAVKALKKGDDVPKTQEELQADYTRLCAQLGQSVLQVAAAVTEIQQRVGALNKEFQELAAVQKQQEEEKKDATPKNADKAISA